MHYYQFNIGDYLSHTLHLDPIEDLAYRRLIDKYFLDEKPIEGDVKTIAKKIRMREHEEEVKNVLSEFFLEKNKKFYNKRIDSELKGYKDYLKKQSLNGKKGGRPKKNPPLNDGKAKANPDESQKKPKQETLNTKQETLTNITNTQLSVVKDANASSKKTELALSDFTSVDVPKELAQDFIAHRKKLKAPISRTAMRGICKEARKANLPLNDVLEMMVTQGWRGFKAEWVNEQKTFVERTQDFYDNEAKERYKNLLNATDDELEKWGLA